MLQDKVGYLQITEFDEVTVSQFRSGLKSLKKQGAKKLIIDLRDNPGGLLTSVVDIAGQILPKGTIVYTEDKNGNKKYYKDTKNEQLDMPLCVLVNGNSASAAEILLVRSKMIKPERWLERQHLEKESYRDSLKLVMDLM